MCLAYVANYGVVTEAKMPYISTNGGSDISPYWPLQGSYTLYRATDILDSCGLLNNLGVDPTNFTANSNSTTTFTASLKTALETDGPLGAAIDSETDWYNLPGTPNTPISSLGGYNGIDHAVVITGFTDDPSTQAAATGISKIAGALIGTAMAFPMAMVSSAITPCNSMTTCTASAARSIQSMCPSPRPSPSSPLAPSASSHTLGDGVGRRLDERQSLPFLNLGSLGKDCGHPLSVSYRFCGSCALCRIFFQCRW